jgi:hypothetical protein
MRVWLCQIDPPTLHEVAPEASDTLIEAINHQNKLDWDQWMYGCMDVYLYIGESYSIMTKNI